MKIKYTWQVRSTGFLEQFPNSILQAFIPLLLYTETALILSSGLAWPSGFFRLRSLQAKSASKLHEGSPIIKENWFTFLFEYINKVKGVTKC